MNKYEYKCIFIGVAQKKHQIILKGRMIYNGKAVIKDAKC